MHKKLFTVILLLLSVVLVASGCFPNIPKPYVDIDNSKFNDDTKILIVTFAKNKNLFIHNHTLSSYIKNEGPVDNTNKYPGSSLLYGMAQSDDYKSVLAATSIITGALVVEDLLTKKKSLGGDSVSLKNELKKRPLNIKRTLEESIVKRLSKRFNVFTLEDLEDETNRPTTEKNMTFKEYRSLANKFDADFILQVNYTYGLATYKGTSASAVVEGKIFVYDSREDRFVIWIPLYSDSYLRNPHNIEELTRDGARIFREDIVSAADKLSLLVANLFEIDTAETESAKLGFHGSISNPASICIRPDTFNQDCTEITGPNRVIHIGNHEATIAGSNDGKEIFITNLYALNDSTDSSKKEGLSTSNNHVSLMGYRTIKYELLSKEIRILREFKVFDNQRLSGFLLELNGDGYSVLKKYTANKTSAGNTKEK